MANINRPMLKSIQENYIRRFSRTHDDNHLYSISQMVAFGRRSVSFQTRSAFVCVRTFFPFHYSGLQMMMYCTVVRCTVYIYFVACFVLFFAFFHTAPLCSISFWRCALFHSSIVRRGLRYTHFYVCLLDLSRKFSGLTNLFNCGAV